MGGGVAAFAHVARCCSWVGTTTTTLIASFVTPGDVAPPLLSPAFIGRTHGGRFWYGIASWPSFGSQYGAFFAASVPTPAAATGFAVVAVAALARAMLHGADDRRARRPLRRRTRRSDGNG